MAKGTLIRQPRFHLTSILRRLLLVGVLACLLSPVSPVFAAANSGSSPSTSAPTQSAASSVIPSPAAGAPPFATATPMVTDTPTAGSTPATIATSTDTPTGVSTPVPTQVNNGSTATTTPVASQSTTT